MPVPTIYSFTRYLAAKKSVDDRALNQQVWRSVVDALPATTPERPLRILEVGAGIGTMVERFFARGAFTDVTYTAIDAEPENMTEARRRLPQWAADQGFCVTRNSPEHMCFQRKGQNLSVETEVIDLARFVARERGQHTWDLLIAHAFLDLIDVSSALPGLFSLLQPDGLFYFTITFDGVTIFEPEIDPAFDARIEALYHQTMNQRMIAGKSSGHSRTGRRLFTHLRAAGAELLDAGSSDWVVFAGPTGYPADEAYFLHFIIHLIHTALAERPDLDTSRFAAWVEQRHAQVEQGTLVYLAHQLDFLGRPLASSAAGARTV